VPPPKAAPKKVTAEEPLLTQNNEEAPEVKKVDPEAEKKRLEKIEADRKIREQVEAERKKKELEEIERKRIEAEQKRQSDIMNRTRDALANSKNSGTNSKSEGEAGGAGNQGDPRGSVDSKNRGTGGGLGNQGSVSYDLGGRGSQSLPKPNYDYQGEGRVVVDVSVDRAGKVTQATPGTKGSTTLDEYLLKVAKEAALKARFDPKADAPVIQKGKITYIFQLR
jgi:TonB family protein